MLDIRHLMTLVDQYELVTGCSDKTLSGRMFSDSKKVSAMRSGADITVSRFNAAILWLSAHWPDGAHWPSNIPRPQFNSNSPEVLPSGEAGAQRSPAVCAPAPISGEAVR
ncbi:hypothetical protein CQ059_04730 [Brucella pseudogrignonensis]|nr:hypothetical protein CQ059_04730 [Brucella pseudogrignonensis]PRA42992.1 hypothetical protein CQ063_01215 [Brucella pseudogrignonensis]PRA72540.1 hypothetical protein CQ055_04365 [Brucella pseudogrignonensis]